MGQLAIIALDKFLQEPSEKHLDDAMLAQLADIEMMGEDIDERFPEAVAHLESCVQCADAYAELMVLLEVGDAAIPVMAPHQSPLTLYTDVILRELRHQGAFTVELIESAARTLALVITDMKAIEREDSISDALKQLQNVSSELTTQMAAVINQHKGLLKLFLQDEARWRWGKNFDVKTAVSNLGHRLQFQPAPQLKPTLSGSQVGDVWDISNRRVGRPLPLTVVIKAEKTSDLACTLHVRIDRPGLIQADGRQVILQFGTITHTMQTDPNGTALFTEIPIAALPAFTIDFA